MTQSFFTDDNTYERDPALRFENLPEPMQRRLFELMAAMTGADQIYVAETPVAAPAPTKPKPEAGIPSMHQLIGGMSEQATMIKEAREMAENALTGQPAETKQPLELKYLEVEQPQLPEQLHVDTDTLARARAYVANEAQYANKEFLDV